MEIEAKIAALLSDTKLAVNVGSLSDVAKGDDVVIFETVSVTDLISASDIAARMLPMACPLPSTTPAT